IRILTIRRLLLTIRILTIRRLLLTIRILLTVARRHVSRRLLLGIVRLSRHTPRGGILGIRLLAPLLRVVTTIGRAHRSPLPPPVDVTVPAVPPLCGHDISHDPTTAPHSHLKCCTQE